MVMWFLRTGTILLVLSFSHYVKPIKYMNLQCINNQHVQFYYVFLFTFSPTLVSDSNPAIFRVIF